MRNKWLKRFFPLIALLFLVPWPIAYAHTYTSGMAQTGAAQIEVAEASAAPSWTVFGKAIGGATAGDLFYIDADNTANDIVVTLYLTNAHELSRHLRFLVLEVGIYLENSAGQWQRVPPWDGRLPPATFITLRHSPLSFTLDGNTKYKITIDAGSFYCMTTNANGNII